MFHFVQHGGVQWEDELFSVCQEFSQFRLRWLVVRVTGKIVRYREIRAVANSVGKACVFDFLPCFVRDECRVADGVRILSEKRERVAKRSAVRKLHGDARV